MTKGAEPEEKPAEVPAPAEAAEGETPATEAAEAEGETAEDAAELEEPAAPEPGAWQAVPAVGIGQ